MEDERLKGCELELVEKICNEIISVDLNVKWDDIAGLQFAKNTVREITSTPLMRPDIFHGLRAPPKGLLLFGPPGTGKTLIGKAIAGESKSTFFSISASSLTSKWIGEGEKMVKTLFAVAKCLHPSVIFNDEIDSLLTQRSDQENEASRRIKTELLVQWDGANSGGSERILVIGATNRPQELDEAARRRLAKRLYIPLPDLGARKVLIRHLLQTVEYELTEDEFDHIGIKSDGYSGADIQNLCTEAAYGPLREVSNLRDLPVNEVRPVRVTDFDMAINQIRASVGKNDLLMYEDWNKQYGTSFN